jgi:hypothetical protein
MKTGRGVRMCVSRAMNKLDADTMPKAKVLLAFHDWKNKRSWKLFKIEEFKYQEELIPRLFDLSLEGWAVSKVNVRRKTNLWINLEKDVDYTSRDKPFETYDTNLDAPTIRKIADFCCFQNLEDFYDYILFGEDYFSLR